MHGRWGILTVLPALVILHRRIANVGASYSGCSAQLQIVWFSFKFFEVMSLLAAYRGARLELFLALKANNSSTKFFVCVDATVYVGGFLFIARSFAG